MSLETLKPGDVFIRMLAGVIRMEMRVLRLGGETIVAIPTEWEGTGRENADSYTFDRKTGAEIDDDLGWGPTPKFTGSYIELKD